MSYLHTDRMYQSNLIMLTSRNVRKLIMVSVENNIVRLKNKALLVDLTTGRN